MNDSVSAAFTTFNKQFEVWSSSSVEKHFSVPGGGSASGTPALAADGPAPSGAPM